MPVKTAKKGSKSTFDYKTERDIPYRGENALTCEQAMTFLGYRCDRPQTDSDKGLKIMDEERRFIDELGRNVICTNLSANRQFYEAVAQAICQDILTGNWRFNWENIIISKSGQIIQGQHRLVGFVFACQKWDGVNKERYLSVWPEEPTLECRIAFGASDDPEVLRTLDNTRPRSDEDVLMTDTNVFGEVSSVTQRQELNRILANAVKFLWDRAGWSNTNAEDAIFHEYHTRSGTVKFVNQHAQLVDAVQLIFDLSTANKTEAEKKAAQSRKDTSAALNKFSSGGLAAGLMYLMGASQSDINAYITARGENLDDLESVMNFKAWKNASAFWTELAMGASLYKAIGKVRRPVDGDTKPKPGEKGNGYSGFVFAKNGGGTRSEKCSLICKAWKRWLDEEPIGERSLELQYKVEYDPKTGILLSTEQDEWRSAGGIDHGDPNHEPDDKEGGVVEEEEVEDEVDTDEEGEGEDADDVAAAAAEEARKKSAKLAAKKAKEKADRKAAENGKVQPAAAPAATKPKAKGGKGTTTTASSTSTSATTSFEEELADLHGGDTKVLVLFERGPNMVAWRTDADACAQVLGLTTKADTGSRKLEFPKTKVTEYTKRLTKQGYKVVVAEGKDAIDIEAWLERARLRGAK